MLTSVKLRLENSYKLRYVTVTFSYSKINHVRLKHLKRYLSTVHTKNNKADFLIFERDR
jgi:hypothetical protein